MPRGSFPLGNPFSGGARAPGMQGGFGPGPAVPGFDPDTINAALKPYGVSMPETYQQPGIAENTGWGQAHPRLATGIDNALIAVAGMGPTGETAGENISNVARGVMGIQPFRRQYAAEQAMIPFQIAKEVGGLQAQQSYMHMQDKMAEYYGDRGQAAVQANLAKTQIAQINTQTKLALEQSKEPMLMDVPDPNNPGKTVKQVGFPTAELDANGAPTGKLSYVPNPQIDAEAFMQQHHQDQLSKVFGVGGEKDGSHVFAYMADALGGAGKIDPDITKWTPKMWDLYKQGVEWSARQTPGVMAAGMRRGANELSMDWRQFSSLKTSIMSAPEYKAPNAEEVAEARRKGMAEAIKNHANPTVAANAAEDALRKSREDARSAALTHIAQQYAEWQHMAHVNPQAASAFTGFQDYWQQMQNTGADPFAAPAGTTSTPTGTLSPITKTAPSLSDTIQQLSGLLSKTPPPPK